MEVWLSDEAGDEFDALPGAVQERVIALTVRLADWPQVSGVKWLAGAWKNHARIRTGDYRVIFHLERDGIVIDRIAHRRDAYGE